MARLSSYGYVGSVRAKKCSGSTVSQVVLKSRTYLGFVAIASVMILGFFYILQMTSVSTKGYDVEKYEKRLNELKRENQKLQVELADLSSIENFEQAGEKLSKIDAKDVNYIVSNTSVALDR